MPSLNPVIDVEFVEDAFTPSVDGQTLFTLSREARPDGLNILFINTVAYQKDIDYTVSGTTLTWLNNFFLVENDDRLLFKYEPA